MLAIIPYHAAVLFSATSPSILHDAFSDPKLPVIFGALQAWGVALIFLLATTHTITVPSRGEAWPSLGQWLIYMSVITWTTAFAALRHSPIGFLAQATLGGGAAIGAAGLLTGSSGWQQAAGWVFVAAATFSFYVGAALMLDSVYGKVALPVLLRGGAEPIQYERGDPGVKVGQ